MGVKSYPQGEKWIWVLLEAFMVGRLTNEYFQMMDRQIGGRNYLESKVI